MGIPYLRAKAKDYFEELGGGIDSDILEDVSDARRIQALTDEVCNLFIDRDIPTLTSSTVNQGTVPQGI